MMADRKSFLPPMGKVTEWVNPASSPDQIQRAKERAGWAAMMKASARAANALQTQDQHMQDPAYAEVAAEALAAVLQQQRAQNSQMLPPISQPADLAAMGRGGDNMVAHINEEEAALLKRRGGAGTINPATGLPEFRPTGSWGKDSPASGGRVGGRLGNTGARSDGTRGGSVGLGSSPATRAAAFGKSIYSDIKIADPATERILNPNKYGGIVTQKGGQKFSTGNDDLAFNSAIDKWNQRTWFDRGLNFFAPFGLSSEKPDYSRPATFSGGDFHTSINPAAAATSVLSMLAPPGVGLIASPVAGAVYNEFGGKNPVLTGPDTVYADDGTGGMARPGVSAPGAPLGPGAGSPGMGRTGQGGLLPQIAGNPAAMAPPAVPGAPPAPGPGAPLPPITGPQTHPGAYIPVAGPSAYGWSRPTWRF
jgi:hypothetical protein